VPLQKKSIKKYRSFDFGVSYRVGENRERLKDALNVFTNQGRLSSRYGRSLWLENLLGGPVLSLSFFKNSSGTRYLLAKVGTVLYRVNPTGSHTSIKTGLSAGTKHRGITWARGSTSRHIISIEEDGLFQWDGTTFTQLGQDPPEGHTVAITAGTMTGTFRIHLTYYSSTTGFESNSTASDPIVLTADGIFIDDIPNTADNATIDKIRIYLEDTASPDDPLFCDEISLGTTSATVGSLPTSAETRPLSNAKPLYGGGKYLVEFNHRLVYAGNSSFKNDVFFSEADLPDAFNDGNGPDRLVIYAGGNGEITGLATGLYNNSVLDPYLVIFKKRSTEVYSEISGEGRSVVISSEIGCVSHETIKVKNGNVFFLSDHGWRVIENGRLLTKDGNPATLADGDVDDIFRQPGFTYEINKAQANNAFSVYYSTLDQYLTWVPEGASTDLLKTYCFEFKTNSFKPYQFQSASTAACIGEDASGFEVVYMGDANGGIYTHSVNESQASDDDSTGTESAINAFAILPWLDGDDMDSSYNWRELILRRVSGSGNMVARAFVNFSLDESASLDFLSEQSGFVLDVDKLDEGILQEAGRGIETSRADINLCGENLAIGFYQQAVGTSLELVSAQVECNKNGNRN
jgi:hypothetical protein